MGTLAVFLIVVALLAMLAASAPDWLREADDMPEFTDVAEQQERAAEYRRAQLHVPPPIDIYERIRTNNPLPGERL
jgi:hypothetical protein